MLRPGRYYVGSPIRLEIYFEDDDGNLVDPDTVKCKTKSPRGQTKSYTYMTDDAVGRTSEGIYYCDVTPNETGRWFIRWESTGEGRTIAQEDNFLIQYSEFACGG